MPDAPGVTWDIPPSSLAVLQSLLDVKGAAGDDDGETSPLVTIELVMSFTRPGPLGAEVSALLLCTSPSHPFVLSIYLLNYLLTYLLSSLRSLTLSSPGRSSKSPVM